MAPSSVAVRPTSRISPSTRSTGSCNPQPGTSQTPQEIGPPASRSISPPCGLASLSSTIPLPQPRAGPVALERSNSYAPPVTLSRVPLVACLVLAGCAGDAAADPSAAVVTIAATGCRPTPNVAHGVAVGEELVATVAHAVAGEDEIIVRDRAGEERRGTVVAIDTVLDAAVLRVPGLDAELVGRRPYEEGEEVSVLRDDDGAVVAAPASVTRRVTIRTSDIYREGSHSRPALDLVADVRPGDSGAPVVGADGDVLALVWATSRRTDDRAWALPIDALAPLISTATTATEPLSLRPRARDDRELSQLWCHM